MVWDGGEEWVVSIVTGLIGVQFNRLTHQSVTLTHNRLMPLLPSHQSAAEHHFHLQLLVFSPAALPSPPLVQLAGCVLHLCFYVTPNLEKPPAFRSVNSPGALRFSLERSDGLMSQVGDQMKGRG